jgi:hypothetical protein
MSSCAANSFVPGTSVLMADGAKKEIEKIELGDLVLATDAETGKTSARAVVTTITGTGVKDLVTVSVTDGSGQTDQVTATAGHPFWVPDIEEWVDAGELRPGMWVQTSSGTWVQVTAIEHDHREQTVHNLTIDTTHTYSVYAGADAILTHNCGEVALPGDSRSLINSTNRGSRVTNLRTDATPGEVRDTLLANGFSSRPIGNGVHEFFERGAESQRYGLRPDAKSWSGWTLDVFQPGGGPAVIKIRLEGIE